MQIQAYLDNLFDVGTLLEDAETKNAALERVEELEESLSHVRGIKAIVHTFLHNCLGTIWAVKYITQHVHALEHIAITGDRIFSLG